MGLFGLDDTTSGYIMVVTAALCFGSFSIFLKVGRCGRPRDPAQARAAMAAAPLPPCSSPPSPRSR